MTIKNVLNRRKKIVQELDVIPFQGKTIVCYIGRMKELKFSQIISLAEKSKLFDVKNALIELREAFEPYSKYWILNDKNISLLNPQGIGQIDSKKMKLLEKFGLKQDFDSENSLVLLKNLCTHDLKGEYAPQIYRELYNEKFHYEEEFKIFTKTGNYENNNKVYYLADTTIPKALMEKYMFINLPVNLDANHVTSTFNIKQLPNFIFKIENYKEIKFKNELNEYLNTLKPYLLAFGTKGKTSKEYDSIANKLRILEINVGNFDCFLDGKNLNLENFEMIYFENKFYIKTNSRGNFKKFYKDTILTDSIINIFLTIFDIEYRDKIKYIFRYSDFEDLEKELSQEYGENSLTIAKNHLKNIGKEAQDIYGYVEDICDSLDNSHFDDNNIDHSSDANKQQDYDNTNHSSNVNNQQDYDNTNHSSNVNNQQDYDNTNHSSNVNNQQDYDNDMENNYFDSNNNTPYDINNALRNGGRAAIHLNFGNRNSSRSEKNQEAGRQAEELVKKRFPNYIQVSGYVGGNDKLGYDFEYMVGNIKYFVEVKNFSGKQFFITENELKVAKLKKERYHIYLVDCNSILDIGNPFIKKEYKLKDI